MKAFRIKGTKDEAGNTVVPDTFNTQEDGKGKVVTAQSIGHGQYVAVKEVATGKVLLTDAEHLDAKRKQLQFVVNDTPKTDAEGNPVMAKDKDGKVTKKQALRWGRLRKSLYGIGQLTKSFKGAKSKRGIPWTKEQAVAIIAMHRQQLDELESILLNTTTETTEQAITM